FAVHGTHTYAEEGTYHVTVHATDNEGNPLNTVGRSTTTITSATFNLSDPAVVASAGPNFAATEGLAFTGQTVATFTDPGGVEPNASDPGAISLHYSADINWGDGSGWHLGAGTISLSGVTYTVKGDYTYAEEGVYTV